MSKKFEVLTGRDQIRRRPQMWIGSMDPVTQDMFIASEDKVERKSVTYIPAFKKICDEVLDNAIDALLENENGGAIKVKMADDFVSIADDGNGIPVIKKKLTEAELKSLPEEEAKRLADSYLPEIAWTRLFSGTNFSDGEDKKTIGAHGVGSKATAIFSTKFVGHTDDGKKSCVVTAVNGLESSKCKVKPSSGSTGTTVEFWPDLAAFKLKKIEQVYMDLMYQRLLCLAITFPSIKFSFNGKKLNINAKKFLKMFSENIEYEVFDKGFVGVFPNAEDEFNFFTYVNGMHMSRGGAHIDHISWNVVNPIREKLCKKFKSIKPADIKNRLTMVVFLRDFPSPKFDSQTKETLTNATSEVAKYLGDSIDFEKFGKTILKNDAIIGPIVETFKIKEELKARSELKKIKKVKVRSDKYMSPIGESKYLALCEGASAMSGISSCLGRKGIAYYGMRGVPLNVYDSNIQRIAANQECKDIFNILGLDMSSKVENKSILFDKVLITTDNDCFDADTLVNTANGLKRIADITYDDKILSSDGEYHQILEILQKKTKELVVIEVAGTNVVTTPMQKLIVVRGTEIIEVFAKDLKTTDYLLKRKA